MTLAMGLAFVTAGGCLEPAGSSGGRERLVTPQLLNNSPALKQNRFQNLLSFETRSDEVFVAAENLDVRADRARAHTGQLSLRLSPRTTTGSSGRATIKLSSILGNREFPGPWSLAGGYFYSESAVPMTLRCLVGDAKISEQTVTLQPGQWSAVSVELITIDPQAAPTGPAVLQIEMGSSGVVWCDDIVLLDNTRWYVSAPDEVHRGQWLIFRRGQSVVVSMPDAFTLRLADAAAYSGGWQVEEANILRARFTTTGKDRALTVFPDGSSFWAGQFRPLSTEARSFTLLAEQHTSPAEVEIPETLGRVERQSPGDENNDGYNEQRGAYMIHAAGARLEIKLQPRSRALMRPMLEIKGLPRGEVLATVDGALIQKTLRLPDDTLLVQIPGMLTREATINIGVK